MTNLGTHKTNDRPNDVGIIHGCEIYRLYATVEAHPLLATGTIVHSVARDGQLAGEVNSTKLHDVSRGRR